jgi:hypothetical protein
MPGRQSKQVVLAKFDSGFYFTEASAPRSPRARKATPPAVSPEVTKAVSPLPTFMQDVCKTIARTPYVGDGIKMMLERKNDFRNPTAALLAGITIEGAALRMFEDALDAAWTLPKPITAKIGPRSQGFEEVVIGGGQQAAIYCAIRVQSGYPRPLVLEAEDRVGGVFATAKSATFYLNSRNRPGESSVPGQPGALNALPGSIVQPSDLGGEEYQTDAQMAVAIRTALAMYADVRTKSRVMDVRFGSFGRDGDKNRNHQLILDDGTIVNAGRVVLATGLGKPIVLGREPGAMVMSDRILTYTDFLRRLDQPFPLRGMERVAVVGAGDSGRTVIEALCGQGPGAKSSVASVDWPQQIDWYGLDVFTKSDFERCNRSRYKGIGRLLPRSTDADSQRMARVISVYDRDNGGGLRPSQLIPGYNCVYVNERSYDHVIVCTGFERKSTALPLRLQPFLINGRQVGFNSVGNSIVTIGPCMDVPISSMEVNALGAGVAEVNENSAALFRYAQRTAQAAMFLPPPAVVGTFSRDDIASASF